MMSNKQDEEEKDQSMLMRGSTHQNMGVKNQLASSIQNVT